MIRMIITIVGVILLLWFLLPFFSYCILNIGNLTGIGVSLVLLFYGLFFGSFNRFVAWFWQKTPGKVIELVVGAAILAILVLAVLCMICMGRGMTATVSPQPRPSAADASQRKVHSVADDLQQADAADAEVPFRTVIVLGCKTIGDRPSLMLSERLQAALAYLQEHPAANVIVSGGLGEDETVAEAEVMQRWLAAHGIAEARILVEAESRDTHENLANCYALLLQKNASFPEPTENRWSEQVLLATNEFHEYRALKIARAAGFAAEPLPAKTAWWLFPTYYVREMYGILEDWFLV